MAVELELLETPRRVDGVVERLRSLILTGAYSPGVQLPNERELAHSLGVNRGSVREALQRLEFLELIDVRHGQGSFVREISGSSALQLVEALLGDRRTITRELLAQILEFRRHIAIHVVELAAIHRTPQHLERARRLLAEDDEAGGDPERALEVDVQMNVLLGQATGNLMYQFLSNLFARLIRQLGPLYYNDRRDHARSLRTHLALLAALEAGDPGRARHVLEEMLRYSEESILAQAEQLEAEALIGPNAREDAS